MIEIRIARGLGGKGFLVFTGEVSSVRSAVKACATIMGETGDITSHCVIPAPHKDLVKQLLAQ
jgi:microcompartment protein CcmL/EutN